MSGVIPLVAELLSESNLLDDNGYVVNISRVGGNRSGSTTIDRFATAGTITNLKVHISHNNLNGSTTISINNIDTNQSLAVSYNAGEVGIKTASGSFSYSPGQKVHFQVNTLGSSTGVISGTILSSFVYTI